MNKFFTESKLSTWRPIRCQRNGLTKQLIAAASAPIAVEGEQQ